VCRQTHGRIQTGVRLAAAVAALGEGYSRALVSGPYVAIPDHGTGQVTHLARILSVVVLLDHVEKECVQDIREFVHPEIQRGTNDVHV
jgi:hypothetical protein